MKLGRFTPPQPASMFTMTFTRDEGWTVLMALRDAVSAYKEAADRKEWAQWANELEKELRA